VIEAMQPPNENRLIVQKTEDEAYAPAC
jgi:hypothetical protein